MSGRPARVLWRSGHEAERDNIAVIEVMVAKLAPEFWRILRERLERELSHAARLGTLSITYASDEGRLA
ncbi:hypothetical protein IVB34_20235 [Bradyrhizobium sp. 2]|uniref:hypothetical protein n=1 Tax=Bradyrhizobium sp. 2 TaxID=190045 RepID=UPI001FF9CABA|nr:hypothetical protein [Bradyrhizobium sp. 2]MCK1460634.1 hypothetical protein [Bradyrhizobium sp. 2]